MTPGKVPTLEVLGRAHSHSLAAGASPWGRLGQQEEWGPWEGSMTWEPSQKVDVHWEPFLNRTGPGAVLLCLVFEVLAQSQPLDGGWALGREKGANSCLQVSF